MIHSISIKNIKGIKDRTFELNIHPNKPVILVAANGFGKSSFATAFDLITDGARKVKIQKHLCHEGDESLKPEIKISLKEDESIIELVADDSQNQISQSFGVFVIREQLFAKAKGSPFGSATASLAVQDIEIYKIGNSLKMSDVYNFEEVRDFFSKHGLTPVNLIDKLKSNDLCQLIIDNKRKLKNTSIYNEFLNPKKPTPVEDRYKKIKNEDIIEYFMSGLGFSREDSVNCLMQLYYLVSRNTDAIFDACQTNICKSIKKEIEKSLSLFNSSWGTDLIKVKMEKGVLKVVFPSADKISNGQRDIYLICSMLFKAEIVLNKKKNLIIIDEVFDYLDKSNMLAAQYFISNFIERIREQGKEVYPVILTHLDPDYFKNYVFPKQQVRFLSKRTSIQDINFKKLLRLRNKHQKTDDEKLISDIISEKLLHFYPNPPTERELFRTHGIKETWGEGENFSNFLEDNIRSFLDNADYDPLAVCCAARNIIERKVYNLIDSSQNKSLFIEKHKTLEKISFAESIDVDVPFSYRIIAILFNDAMHWSDSKNNLTSIQISLDNLVIKSIIKNIVNDN